MDHLFDEDGFRGVDKSIKESSDRHPVAPN